MGHINASAWVFAVAVCAALLVLNPRRVAEKIIEAINNFPRGGPPAPMHPSPAGDDALLRRRSKKVES
jgi:hypothetical protein